MTTSESFLPDFCNLTSTFALVGFSLLLAFVLTLADFASMTEFWFELGLRALFITWVALASGAVLCLLRRPMAALGPVATGVAALAIIQLITFGFAIAAHSVPLQPQSGLAAGSAAWRSYARILGVSLLVSAACLRYLYVQASWRRQIRAEGVARLDALQARMRPHFLFNSLNTVASLTRRNPALAEELLLDLAELFRAILKKEGKLVPLADEAGLTRQYLNIEQQRLGERLRVVWKMDHAPRDALIPPLSLQPVVENAIYHGIEPARLGGTVEIAGRLTRRGLILTVRNTLPEPDARRTRQGTQEAVGNLRARLEACFPGRAKLMSSLVDDRYQVRIVIPYVCQSHENLDRR